MRLDRRKYSRHIGIRRHYVHELALAGVIKLVPLSTHDMFADALTKSLLALLLCVTMWTKPSKSFPTKIPYGYDGPPTISALVLTQFAPLLGIY